MTRATAILAATFAVLAPGEASAWYCRANAADGRYGWASYFDRKDSAREALRECSVRSRRPMTCRIYNCIPD